MASCATLSECDITCIWTYTVAYPNEKPETDTYTVLLTSSYFTADVNLVVGDRIRKKLYFVINLGLIDCVISNTGYHWQPARLCCGDLQWLCCHLWPYQLAARSELFIDHDNRSRPQRRTGLFIPFCSVYNYALHDDLQGKAQSEQNKFKYEVKFHEFDKRLQFGKTEDLF